MPDWDRSNPLLLRMRHALGDGDLPHPLRPDPGRISTPANSLAGFHSDRGRRVDRGDSRRLLGERANVSTRNYRDFRYLFRIRDRHALYIAEGIPAGHQRASQGVAEGNEVS